MFLKHGKLLCGLLGAYRGLYLRPSIYSAISSVTFPIIFAFLYTNVSAITPFIVLMEVYFLEEYIYNKKELYIYNNRYGL